MKQFLLLIVILISLRSSGQVSLSILKNSLLSSSFDNLERNLRDAGYPFEKAIKKEFNSECMQYYMFSRFMSGVINWTEVISIGTKCSDNTLKSFQILRFLTRDEKTYHQIKSQCTEEEKAESISEKVQDGEVISEYKKGNFTFQFRNGADKNGKTYIIDLIYKYPF